MRPPMSRERRRAARECELGEHVERREATETCGSIKKKEKPRLARERIDFLKYKKELMSARRRHAEV